MNEFAAKFKLWKSSTITSFLKSFNLKVTLFIIIIIYTCVNTTLNRVTVGAQRGAPENCNNNLKMATALALFINVCQFEYPPRKNLFFPNSPRGTSTDNFYSPIMK